MESAVTLILATMGVIGDLQRGSVQDAPLWRGVDEIAIVCDVREPAISAGFCDAVLQEARVGTPFIVRLADGSDGPSTLVLSVTVAMDVDTRTLTITGERAVTIDEAQGSLLPRITRAGTGEMIERTLARAFDAALPWRRPRAGTIRAVRS